MLKNIVHTGMGAITVLKDKIEEEIKKLEDSGKIKKDDAKSFLESLTEKGKASEDELKSKMKTAIKEVLDELGIATKDDIAKLKEDLASKK